MSRRILLIDDEADIRLMAQVTLELTMGWTVMTASSGPEGIRVAAEQQPELVLLDAVMPDMDGAATLRALRAAPATSAIPVALLTARAPDLALAEAPGALGVIPKPFDPTTLGAEVAALAGWERGG